MSVFNVQKFKEFFTPQDFRSIFSPDDLFPFSSKGIVSITRTTLSGTKAIDNEAGSTAESAIELDE